MEALERLKAGLADLGLPGERLLADVKLLENELDRRVHRIFALKAVHRTVAAVARIESQEDVDEVLQRILKAALAISGAERGFVVLSKPDSEPGFEIVAAKNIDTEHLDRAQISKTLIKQFLARGESIVTTNLSEDSRFDPSASLFASNIRCVMAAPIALQDDLMGGIYVDSRLDNTVFDKDDLATFSLFTEHIVLAMNLATSFKERRDLYVQSILALVHAVEAADAYTAGHSSRVGYYASAIASLLGLPPREVELLTFAGYLHDVGKIALKAPVGKREALSDSEWVEMRKHPIYGERILRNSPALQDILPAVLHHHECWAGDGYPHGLVGEAIPLYARMIAVADSFDAMTTDRPYRKAYTVPHALEEIKRYSGLRYDRTIADCFVRAFAEGKIALAERDSLDERLAAIAVTA